MSMELISREETLDCVKWGYNLPDCYEKISNVPTVEAIPIERLEQIIEQLPTYLEYPDIEYITIKKQDLINIIAKAIKEQDEWGMEHDIINNNSGI